MKFLFFSAITLIQTSGRILLSLTGPGNVTSNNSITDVSFGLSPTPTLQIATPPAGTSGATTVPVPVSWPTSVAEGISGDDGTPSASLPGNFLEPDLNTQQSGSPPPGSAPEPNTGAENVAPTPDATSLPEPTASPQATPTAAPAASMDPQDTSAPTTIGWDLPEEPGPPPAPGPAVTPSASPERTAEPGSGTWVASTVAPQHQQQPTLQQPTPTPEVAPGADGGVAGATASAAKGTAGVVFLLVLICSILGILTCFVLSGCWLYRRWSDRHRRYRSMREASLQLSTVFQMDKDSDEEDMMALDFDRRRDSLDG